MAFMRGVSLNKTEREMRGGAQVFKFQTASGRLKTAALRNARLYHLPRGCAADGAAIDCFNFSDSARMDAFTI
ncbi:hypothetical protein BG910_02135 [Neisseria chenwenguii]|uniref:Uncharacterized protein n=1 Tax=Neisseria chenwenguii TaxID=1853278 RepID=A0A220RZS1_9NEIS|nr:hypothetical protein BG910_02135 [Neisseria chenwenguii]ROV56366.1 hypothetical protein EGS38_04940 [Neisseria chenwenguii]